MIRLLAILLLMLMTGRELPARDEATNILFILDASSSMRQSWHGETKWIVAKRTLVHLADSLAEVPGTPVRIGLRVYGHQSLPDANDCGDTELILPVGRHDRTTMQSALTSVNPKGITPLEHSLLAGIDDFAGVEGNNVIILLTDGIESCPADPCTVVPALAAHGIRLRPFIIGMDVDRGFHSAFDCLGPFFNADVPGELSTYLTTAVRRSVRRTTLSVHLLDGAGRPTVSDISISMTESGTDRSLGHWIHRLDDRGRPDTLYVPPVTAVDITVHTRPPIVARSLPIDPDGHTVLRLDAARGVLSLDAFDHEVHAVLRHDGRVLDMKPLPLRETLRVGHYELILNTHPVQVVDVHIAADRTTVPSVTAPGWLTLHNVAGNTGVVLRAGDTSWKSVHRFTAAGPDHRVALLPGRYVVVVRSAEDRHTSRSRRIPLTISAGDDQTIDL